MPFKKKLYLSKHFAMVSPRIPHSSDMLVVIPLHRDNNIPYWTLSCGWDKRHIVSCDPLKDASWLPVRAQRSVKCMCNSPETFLLVKIAFAPSSAAMLSLPSLLFHYMAHTHQESCDHHFFGHSPRFRLSSDIMKLFACINRSLSQREKAEQA